MSHCRASKRVDKRKVLYIQKAIHKYGEENFTIELICNCYTKEEYDSLETYYINLFNSRDPEIGYNIHEGGNGGITYNEPRVLTEKQLQALEYGRHKPASEKLKQIIHNNRYGKVVSEETRNKLKLARAKQTNLVTGRLWICDGTSYKRILPELLDNYLKDGWFIKAPSKLRNDEQKQKYREGSLNRKHIHKDGKNKNVKIEEYQYYIDNGWLDGYEYKK